MNKHTTDMQVLQVLANVDRREMPEWGDASDQRAVRLIPDDQLRQDFAEWQAAACQHEKKLIHERPNAIGSIVYVTRCATCGLRLSSAMPHDVVAEMVGNGLTTNKNAIEVFENRESRYASHRRETLEAIANAAADRQQPARRAELAEHRQGDHWRDIRPKVMERCKGLCEGCLSADADEVHHLSYTHVGREFAFELVALCSGCHSRLHNGAA